MTGDFEDRHRSGLAPPPHLPKQRGPRAIDTGAGKHADLPGLLDNVEQRRVRAAERIGQKILVRVRRRHWQPNGLS